MKKIILGIVLMMWMIFTLVLTFTLVGMWLFIPGDAYENYRHSTWMTIGRELLNALIK